MKRLRKRRWFAVVHSFVQSFIHSVVRLLITSLLINFFHPFTVLLRIHFFNSSFTHLFINLFGHSLVQSLILLNMYEVLRVMYIQL